MVAALIPALNDKTMEHVLEAAAAAGASEAAYVIMRLPNELKVLFKEWLAEHYPQRAEHVMSIVRQMRGGKRKRPELRHAHDRHRQLRRADREALRHRLPALRPERPRRRPRAARARLQPFPPALPGRSDKVVLNEDDSGLGLGWGWAAAIVWLSLTPSPPQVDVDYGDKLGHFGAYGLLMFWFALLYLELAASARGTLIGFIAMGIGLEFLQGMLGYRSFDVHDMAANTHRRAARLGAPPAWRCASPSSVEHARRAPAVGADRADARAAVGARRAAGRVPVDGVGRRHLFRRPSRHRAARRPRARLPADHAAADDLGRRHGRRRLLGHRARARRRRSRRRAQTGGARAGDRRRHGGCASPCWFSRSGPLLYRLLGGEGESLAQRARLLQHHLRRRDHGVGCQHALQRAARQRQHAGAGGDADRGAASVHVPLRGHACVPRIGIAGAGIAYVSDLRPRRAWRWR